jgi:hypothetical protein
VEQQNNKPKGKKLEKFVTSHHLHIINEENEKNFQRTGGESNIDFTITNNEMLADVKTGTYLRKKAPRITT